MVRRLLFIMVALTVFSVCAVAQNSIDDLVDWYSSVGRSKFTSAVERDPKTRKVQKVVKVLELHENGIKKLIKAFRQEASTGNFSEKREEDGLTLVLTVQTAKQSRVYMFRGYGNYGGESNYSRCKVTVIVKYDSVSKRR